MNGLTDLPLEDLDGATPLEKALTPNLDLMAREGACFTLLPPKHGGFETSLAALFGMRRQLEGIRCGPIEAHSQGIVLELGQYAYSARLVALGEETIVDVSEQLVTTEEASALCAELNRGLATSHCHFTAIGGPHLVLVTRAPELCRSTKPLDLSPAELVGREFKTLAPAKQSAGLLERIAELLEASEINALKRELGESPANGIWLREGGTTLPTPLARPIDWTFTSSSPLSMGLASHLGIPCGKSDRRIIENFEVWESTYHGKLLEKIKRIELIDREVIGPMLEKGVRLTVLPLKNTDIRWGKKVAGPVPTVTYPAQGARLNRFEERAFTELAKRPLQMSYLALQR